MRFGIAFYPQTNGQSEITIQILEDSLRVSALDFGGNWDKQVPLIEFDYNNSYQSSLDLSTFEALYDMKCRTPICWEEVKEKKLLYPELIFEQSKQILKQLKIDSEVTLILSELILCLT